MYQYSNAYYHAPLPGVAPQYAAPQYAAYVQYPQVIYHPVAPQAVPAADQGKPKKIHRYTAPPPLVKLNPFINTEHRGTKDGLVWDVAAPWEHAGRLVGNKVSELSDRHFDQPATDPPVPIMWIICKDFDYRLKVKGVQGGVTIGHVVQGIYFGLRVDLEEDEWLDRSEDERTLIHENRCVRLGRESANFEIEGQLRRIDALFDKTIFGGLKQVGPPENYEWELKLVKPKPKDEKGKGKVSWWP